MSRRPWALAVGFLACFCFLTLDRAALGALPVQQAPAPLSRSTRPPCACRTPMRSAFC